MEYCSTDLTNESKQSYSGIVHVCDTEDDDDKECVIVNKEGQQLLPASLLLITNNLCNVDDEPWAIEEDDDYLSDNSDDTKIPPLKTVGDNKNEKSSKTFPNNKQTEEKLHCINNDKEMFINSAFFKIFEDIFDADNAINAEQFKLEEKSELSKQQIFNKNINNDQDLDETNKIVWDAINIVGTSCSTSIPGTSSLTDLMNSSGFTCLTDLPVPPCSRSLLDTSWLTTSPGLSYNLSSPSYLTDLQGPSCSTSLPGPSYSTDLPGPSGSTSLPSPACSTDLPGPSGSTYLSGSSCSADLPDPYSSIKFPTLYNSKRSPSNLEVILNNFNNKKGNDIKNIINRSYSDLFRPIEIPKTNSDTNQDYLKFPKLVSNDNLEDFECFQDDPDIVNPEIMYNIDLNEHYKYMDLLVQKITNATSELTKQTVLNECMRLMPIPEIKHESRVFTDDERSKFSNGICEWKYKIDHDDWEKILIKRAVVFSAHAGFDDAKDDTLYTLVDITTRYIKWIAAVMKKNFDLQSKSSYPERIDPINNSLQEVSYGHEFIIIF